MLRSFQFRRPSSGFTLLELAIIIAIVGILAAVGGVKYMDMTAAAEDAGKKSALANARSALAVGIAKEADHLVTIGELPTYLSGMSDADTDSFRIDGKYEITFTTETVGTVTSITGFSGATVVP